MNFLLTNIYLVRNYVPPRYILPSESDFMNHVLESIWKNLNL